MDIRVRKSKKVIFRHNQISINLGFLIMMSKLSFDGFINMENVHNEHIDICNDSVEIRQIEVLHLSAI